jgi:deoxyribodipyrimidine photo-lyase
MVKPSKINIFWFRRDLRLDDNVGLFHALSSDLPVIPIFIFDSSILKKLDDKSDSRIDFIHHTVTTLKQELQVLGSDLLTFYDSPIDVMKTLVSKYNIQDVYTNEDYEPDAIKRDLLVSKFLDKSNRVLKQYKDQYIFAKNDILKKDKTPYTVYTPYKNKWLDQFTPIDMTSLNCKKYYESFCKVAPSKMVSLEDIGFIHSEKNYLLKKSIKRSYISNYHLHRDIPHLDATSKLGIHLRFGTISVRKCVQIGMKLNATWLSEIIWREFFMQILYHFPHSSRKAFKPKYEKINWRNNKTDFQKWCDGKTGYPMVDAGMRELNQTGHMHNRVRMVTASFLIKHLLIDWRWGEKYFAKKLLDFDLASNNGNWQWAAGTGCDSAPYFRIFNPYTQQKKFDPDLIYIKKWIPEYGTDQYPEEIVEHKMAYRRAIDVYKSSLADSL